MSDVAMASGEDRPGCGLVAFGMAGAASLVAAGITFAMMDVKLFPPVFVVTLAIVLGLGGAAFIFIRERPTWLRVLTGGFVTGALVPALLVMIFVPDSASVRGIATVVDGSYTWAGWERNLYLVLSFGLAGIVGAALARMFVQWLLRGGIGAKAVIGGLIVAAVAAIWLVPWATMDRSCHNTLRDGRTSISPVAQSKFDAAMEDWPEVLDELAVFAAENGWQMRDDVRIDPAFPWFQVSLCREPGTNIFVTTAAFEEDRMLISVSQPQGGNSWRAPFDELRERLERRWPVEAGP